MGSWFSVATPDGRVSWKNLSRKHTAHETFTYWAFTLFFVFKCRSLEIAFEDADVFCQGTTLEVKGSIHLVTFFLVGKHWEETHNYYKNRRHRKQKLKFPQNYSWFSTKCTVVHSQARSGAGDDLPKYSLFLSSSVVDTPLLLPINSFLSKR